MRTSNDVSVVCAQMTSFIGWGLWQYCLCYLNGTVTCALCPYWTPLNVFLLWWCWDKANREMLCVCVCVCVCFGGAFHQRTHSLPYYACAMHHNNWREKAEISFSLRFLPKYCCTHWKREKRPAHIALAVSHFDSPLQWVHIISVLSIKSSIFPRKVPVRERKKSSEDLRVANNRQRYLHKYHIHLPINLFDECLVWFWLFFVVVVVRSFVGCCFFFVAGRLSIGLNLKTSPPVLAATSEKEEHQRHSPSPPPTSSPTRSK